MDQKFLALKSSRLFDGVNESEIESFLECFRTSVLSFKKDEVVIREGERVQKIYVLLEGSLYIQKDDYWGNRSILAEISPGEMFGEAYVAPESGGFLNEVYALTDSKVIAFNVLELLSTCQAGCSFHQKVIQNLFFTISEKNRKLVQKISHLTKRSTREKLLSYLSEEEKRQGSPTFSIPFNRQELADYLSVDRSAMSSELSKLKREGLIEYDKNHFRLK
ncbi:Crp/Fnr family transcriptional regulator [Guggenheimella bovis]